jgi:hypothetical protein
LQLSILQPGVSGEPVEGASLKTLIKDPYILIAAGNRKKLKRFIIFIYLIKLGAISFGNVGIAVMEPSLPIWMMTTMKASEFQQGKNNLFIEDSHQKKSKFRSCIFTSFNFVFYRYKFIRTNGS